MKYREQGTWTGSRPHARRGTQWREAGTTSFELTDEEGLPGWGGPLFAHHAGSAKIYSFAEFIGPGHLCLNECAKDIVHYQKIHPRRFSGM